MDWEPTQLQSTPQAQPTSVPGVYELTMRIKESLEKGFSDVVVEGEVSGLKMPPSGHLYFTLKDGKEDASLSCVIWRANRDRLRTLPEEGARMVMGGRIQVYASRGIYQLSVHSVRAAGLGGLLEAFERLKAKLHAEGLFDASRKRSLPRFPMRIGVVTSATGAAFHDIHSTLQRRWPVATLVLRHASVQGENAVSELIQGIEDFGRRGDVDLVIIGRGGGAAEDLWAFNDERLARTIAACPIPVVSAVGHEIDTTISDLVADVRAATPTQAAELSTPDIDELRMKISDLDGELRRRVTERVRKMELKVQLLAGSYALKAFREKVANRRQQLDKLRAGLAVQASRYGRLQDRVERMREMVDSRTRERIRSASERLQKMQLRLEQANPEAPLERGYVRVTQQGTWVRRRAEFKPDQGHSLMWKDGTADVEKGRGGA